MEFRFVSFARPPPLFSGVSPTPPPLFLYRNKVLEVGYRSIVFSNASVCLLLKKIVAESCSDDSTHIRRATALEGRGKNHTPSATTDTLRFIILTEIPGV
jgi:hypothetical protein